MEHLDDISGTIVIAHDIRSAQNVGAIFRTADAAGFHGAILSGYSPRPIDRWGRLDAKIAKTALGAEQTLPWKAYDSLGEAIQELRTRGYRCIALEQDPEALAYDTLIPGEGPIALVVGNEVAGLSQEEKALCDLCLEIPMRGMKESLNVSVAFGIAAYAIMNTH